MPIRDCGFARMPSAAFAALVLAGTIFAGAPAADAQIVAIVNGEPITERRHRTAHAADPAFHAEDAGAPGGARRADRRQAQGQLSKRYIAEVPKREIETAFANIARRAGMTVAQFTQDDRAQSGITPKRSRPASMPITSGRRSCAANFRAACRSATRKSRSRCRRPTRKTPARLRVSSCARSCSWCRRARQRRLRSAQERGGSLARAVSRAAIEACAWPWHFRDVAVRETITRAVRRLRRTAASSRSTIPVSASYAARRHAAGRRGVCVCGKTAATRRHARQDARCATQMYQRALSGAVEEIPQGTARASADRIPIARMTRPLALTLGEPAGIGPDITLAAWQSRGELDAAAVLRSRRTRNSCASARERLGLDVPLASRRAATAAAAFADALPVVPLGLPATAEPGQPDATSAPAAIASIRRAVADVSADAPRPSSPIRSPRACSTAPALPSPAIPNISPGWRSSTPASRRIR